MRPRLTFLIRDLGYGGAQRQLVTLAVALRRDFEISVVHFYPGPLESELAAAGIATRCVHKRHRWDLAGFFVRLAREVRATRPDLLHGYLAESNLMTVFLKPFLRGTRIIWGLRDSQTDAALWGTLGRLSFQLGRLLSHRADRIIANSRAGRDYYASKGFPAAKIAVVPNGIDLDRFRPDPAARIRLRADWPFDPEAPLVGFVGRINPMKDHPTFLRSAALVAQAHPRARFVCLGGQDPAHADYAAAMRTLATSLGIADRLAWSRPRQDMPAVYNALDLLVSSSAFGEGFSNVVAEAMACGVPCVVTDVGDSAWLVSDADLAVPPREPEPLAAAILRQLRAAPDAQAQLCERSRKRIEENFSVAHMVRRTRDILATLVPAGESAPLHPALEVIR